MAKKISVKAGEDVKFTLKFDGIADYRVQLYALAQSTWVLLRNLAENCSSEDARPDEFSFKAPPQGESVMAVVRGYMTALVEPAKLKATLKGASGGSTESESIEAELKEGDGSKPFAIKMIVEGK